MSSIFTDYHGRTSGRLLSPRVWQGFPAAEIKTGFKDGIFEFEDFLRFAEASLNIQEADSGATFSRVSDEHSGVVRLTTGATDNNEANFSLDGSGEAGWVIIDDGDGDVFFESRIRVSTVTNNQGAIFVGLMEESSVGANLQTDDTGALADKDYVGFRTLQADTNGLDAVYRTSGGSGEQVDTNEAQVLVADTWYKVGFRYDDTDKKLYYYVDGVIVDSAGVAFDASDFPNGEELLPVFAIKTGEGTTSQLDVDWVAVGANRSFLT